MKKQNELMSRDTGGGVYNTHGGGVSHVSLRRAGLR